MPGWKPWSWWRTRGGRDETVELVEAVLLWTGFDSRPTPTANESRLITRFGAGRAAELLPRIKELRRDFYESNARFATGDLSEMGKLASEEFRKKHPGISDQIVEAFAWCYTYDFK